MGIFIILCAVVGTTFGAPFGGYGHFSAVPVQYYAKPIFTETPASVPFVTGNLQHTLDTTGQYKFAYSSSDGQAKTEHRQVDGGVSGQFSYTSPEGKQISLSYTADKDGFRPVGAHLPVAPEVPPIPSDLAEAYRQSNDRLAKGYEEARLRGDTEVNIPAHVPITYDAPHKTMIYISAPSHKSGYVFTNGY